MNWRTWLQRVLPTSPDVDGVLQTAVHLPAGFSRRAFLRAALLATTAAAVVDIDQLLWLPSSQVVVPELPAGLNVLVTPDWVTREALRILERNLNFVNAIHREYGT